MAKSHKKRMSMAEAADYTGFTTHQLTYAAKMGRLPHRKNGTFGPFSFARVDLDEFVDERRDSGAKAKV